MGIGVSSIRLLTLTARRDDNELQTLMLTNQKTSLLRESSALSREYNNAISAKSYKWTNNSGADYFDLTYNTLMTPNNVNQNCPFVVTDMSGKVVLDKKYKDYANIIAPNGNPNPGGWEENSIAILSELTGIEPERLENAVAYEVEHQAALDELDYLKHTEPSKEGFEKVGTERLLKKIYQGNSEHFGWDGKSWADWYNEETPHYHGFKSENLETDFNGMWNQLVGCIANYFVGEEKEEFLENCEILRKTLLSQMQSPNGISDQENGQLLAYNNKYTDGDGTDGEKQVKICFQALIDYILSGVTKEENDNSKVIWYDTTSSEYTKWVEDHAAWQANYEAVEAELDSQISVLTGEEKRIVQFYAELFSMISEKGWVYDSAVSNPDNFNQMLQNNMYMLTQVNRVGILNEEMTAFDYTNHYQTNLSSNISNLILVNDEKKEEEALADYEQKKELIKLKENIIDMKLQDLNSELLAINNFIQIVTKTRDDNIQNTMNIFKG